MKLVVMAIVAVVLAGNAYSQPAKPVIIKPGKVFEKCLSLTPPQKIAYSFESAAKLNFNLNYRKGD